MIMMAVYAVVQAVLQGDTSLLVDAADGDLKVKFGDGFVRVIAADT